MKKIIAAILTACLAFSLAACGNSKNSGDVSYVLNGEYDITDEVVSELVAGGESITAITFNGNTVTLIDADGGERVTEYVVKGDKLTFDGVILSFDKNGAEILLNGVSFGKQAKNSATEQNHALTEKPSESHPVEKTTQSIELVGELVIDGKPAFNVSPSGKYVMTGCWELYENVTGDFMNWRKIDLTEFAFPPSINEQFVNSLSPFGSDEITWSHSGEKFAIGLYHAGLQQAKFDMADLYVFDIASKAVINLTDVPGEANFRLPYDATGEAYVDYAPAFSEDDKTIYFARVGYREDVVINELCSVPSTGGDVKTLTQLASDQFLTYSLFCVRGAVYYAVGRSRSSGEPGIYMYYNGEAKHLVSYSADINDDRYFGDPQILDVSADGKTLLFADRTAFAWGALNAGRWAELKKRVVLVLDIDTCAYSPLEATTGDNVINALFSPGGSEVLQIEQCDDSPNVISIREMETLLVSVSQVADNDEKTFGAPDFARSVPAQTIWTSNGYISVGSYESPQLYRVITN